ncbi:hypothetical protein BDV34DRAFT_219338 [Aspergillus parasiticus]|uniref:Uncharacterized protein n=1 Tax=Aspergillus parasiticus TaxID=5067 RepID=A0A5N6E5H0_ASPPA|nr:hypothetical protein BDV34DRAFT_219338 [Aspergillus parasiticus]
MEFSNFDCTGTVIKFDDKEVKLKKQLTEVLDSRMGHPAVSFSVARESKPRVARRIALCCVARHSFTPCIFCLLFCSLPFLLFSPVTSIFFIEDDTSLLLVTKQQLILKCILNTSTPFLLSPLLFASEMADVVDNTAAPAPQVAGGGGKPPGKRGNGGRRNPPPDRQQERAGKGKRQEKSCRACGATDHDGEEHFEWTMMNAINALISDTFDTS